MTVCVQWMFDDAVTDTRAPRIDVTRRFPARPSALVVVLHGGQSTGHQRPHRLRPAYLRMVPIARMLAGALRADGVGVGLLRYRYRGWNGAQRDAYQDTERVLDELSDRYSGAATVLVGHSMGGRAALHAAGHPSVRAVCALAPWLEDSDPVDQLSGRALLIVHGAQDRMTDPRQSYSYALRARDVATRVARFEIPEEGHAMLRERRTWATLTRRFVAGELGVEPLAPELDEAYRLGPTS